MESSICNFYPRVAALIIVGADPSLRYTSMLLGGPKAIKEGRNLHLHGQTQHNYSKRSAEHNSLRLKQAGSLHKADANAAATCSEQIGGNT